MTRSPMRRAVRATRQAISPRLAMRTDLNKRTAPVFSTSLARRRALRLRPSWWQRRLSLGRRNGGATRLGLRPWRLGGHDVDRRDRGGRREVVARRERRRRVGLVGLGGLGRGVRHRRGSILLAPARGIARDIGVVGASLKVGAERG